jgi:hypothetical protein
MPQDSLASIVSGQEEREAAEQMHRMFSYLAQNPQQYQQARQYMIETDQLDPEDLPEQMTPQQLAQAAQALSQFSGPPGIGDMLAKQGRNGDTMMAHVNPQEMQLLQAMGGSGTINPQTGQPEYFFKKIKKAIKRYAKPLLGAALGFAVGGPLGAKLGMKTTATTALLGAASGGALGMQSKLAGDSMKLQENLAQQERDILQEAENNRIAEAQAEADEVRAAEDRRQENITLGETNIKNAFSQFDDDFFGKRKQSYLDFATPQLDRQYQDQMRQLTAALARSGNLNSSLRGSLMGELQREYDTGKLSLADSALGYADAARAGVKDAQARLRKSNAELADPGVIDESALAEAQGLLVAPKFDNLGQMLSNLSANVGSPMSAFNTPRGTGGMQLYGGGRGAGRSSAGRLVR